MVLLQQLRKVQFGTLYSYFYLRVHHIQDQNSHTDDFNIFNGYDGVWFPSKIT